MIPVEIGHCYHIYNRGNNSDNIFLDENDVVKFLELYRIYIGRTANTYAFCVMKNHFHFCLEFNGSLREMCYDNRKKRYCSHKEKWTIHPKTEIPEDNRIEIEPKSMLKSFFIAFSRWYNAKHFTTGSLFEKNYERKIIDSEDYLVELIKYINNNPVKHKIVKMPEEYKWSSYNETLIKTSTIIDSKKVLKLFGGRNNFVFVHQKEAEAMRPGGS